MAERVLAVHKVTGILSWVLPTEIENHEALEPATKKQIADAQTAREIEVYGEPIKNGVIPFGPVGPPLDGEEDKAEDVKPATAKDGADNG